jgi:hypothetical protein
VHRRTGRQEGDDMGRQTDGQTGKQAGRQAGSMADGSEAVEMTRLARRQHSRVQLGGSDPNPSHCAPGIGDTQPKPQLDCYRKLLAR